MKCEKLIKTAAVVALILFIAGAVIGTLAVPVVLSMFYSWYWLFLYAGYLLVILYGFTASATATRNTSITEGNPMQNANIGLVDITLTCHFEVKDAEVFGGAGSVGYTSVALKHAKAADQLVGIINNSVQCEGFLYAQRKNTADLLGVPVECVRAITYDQYEAATENDETEDDDEDY